MLLFRFPAESRDHVGADGATGHDAADGRNAVEVPLAGVSAVHALQHVAVSALNRQVDVFADVLVTRHGVEHVVRHVFGMRGAETHPKVWVDRRHHFQELGKANHGLGLVLDDALVVDVPLVGIDVLTQQGDLAVTRLEEFLGFPNDAFRVTAALSAAGEGHHTERTHVVTTPHDADERRHAAFVQSDRADLCVGLLAGEQDVDGFLASFHLIHQIGEVAVGIRAHHQIHELLLLQQLVPQALGHASQDAHHQTGVLRLVAFEVDQSVADALFGVVSDGAGVEQHQVGVVGVTGGLIPCIGQDAGHDFAVAEIHLTAVALQVQFPRP